MSLKATFQAAARELDQHGYELDLTAKVTDYRPKQVQNMAGGSQVDTYKQLPIVGTDAVVLVISTKVTGMKADYEAMVVMGEQALKMKLHALSRPSAEAYQKLIG